MAKKDIKFTLDTIDSRYSPIGTVKQLDSVFFHIKITENGVTKDLTGQTIKLFAIKEDKKIVEQTTKINITNQSEGLVEIELLNAAIQVHGFTYFELEISDSNGIISTADFILRVNKRVGSDEAIESTNEVSTLKEIEVYVAQAKQEIKEFKILQSEMLATNENINNQEDLRVNAEVLRKEAENTRVVAEKEREKVLGTEALKTVSKTVKGAINELNNNVASKTGGTVFISTNFEKIVGSYVAPTTGGFVSHEGWTRSDYIDCPNCIELIINNSTHSSAYNCFYDRDKVYLPNSGFTVGIGQTIVPIPVGAKYFIISNNDESMHAISIELGKKTLGTLEERLIELENTKNVFFDNFLKVMTYNTGLFNDGLTYVGDDEVDKYGIKFRKLLGKQNVDILSTQEFMEYFNESQSIQSIPYITDFKYTNNTKSLGYGSVIFSRLRLNKFDNVDFTTGGRSYIKSFINFNGKEICVINAHTSSEVDFNINRKIQFEELIKEMKKHTYCILCGDFNAYDKSEFDIFKANGLELCNGGNFGWFETWHNCSRPNNGWTNAAIDNIIVSSNISIQNVEIIEGQPSDHAPLIAELKII
ncbi:TPA: BppU family phage baseplate upper protein [Clostridium perfringens]|uniref:endonuclease/exonuclease/phosphatase family protein n=2 Tax=Clostridium perfringens TaxID=1502 RepID=UPI001CB54F98|nr:endonuclease/exonuclease/phosphatase family protein [Clostridium perfringens]MDH5093817.1 Endonuclease/Exonuclease/phosphatase family protein [Clostridium perfringens]HBI6987968.1 BppU family phage baseplate upper protein [Clostridium perfringens]HBI6990929.1 BppU family phage baseplate upper protein [Clostridium perfringens]HBI6997217.1 BppU family phage baseplate upper protein [Clostridium perfringens]HBI7023597.1 BppU family phage baseplate upper protein [Clostridium perfringens]